jgi:uncharacterized protein YuzE
MRLNWDQEADALYIYLEDEEAVSRSEQLDEGTLVDLDRLGHVVGIEILHPARTWPLDALLDRFSLRDADRRVLTSFAGLGGRYAFARPLEGVS